VIKSRRMGRVGNVAHNGARRVAFRVVVEKPEGKRGLDDLGVDWKIILKLTFKNWVEGAWTAVIWLRTVSGGRLFMNAVMNLCFP
jgi:hypothetical protein